MIRRIGRLAFTRIPLWSWRICLYGTFAATLLVGGLILGLRYGVLPNIDAYRADLERVMSAATGQRITIGKVSADWRGLRPQLTLEQVTLFDHAGRPALELGRIENSLAWSTLLFFEPRFHSFEIDRPHLAMRRAPDGTIWIAGIELRASGGGGGLADWVLRQPRISIKRASVSWLDEQRQAPELRLEHVTLRLQNDFYRHRFGLRARGPDGVLGTLDVRGDLYGASVSDLRQWEGRLYLRLDEADLAAHRQWIDLPVEVARGEGALRMWVDLANEGVSAVTADVHLGAVSARLAPQLEPLAFDRLSGRIGWRALPSGSEVFTRALSASARGGQSFGPADFSLRTYPAAEGKPSRAELAASALDLDVLARIAGHLPIAEDIRRDLARYAPRGRVSSLSAKWRGSWPPAQFEVDARFERLGVDAVGAVPGLDNVSGSLEANEKRGTMSLANRDLRLQMPRVFAAPLAFDTLSGQLSWTVNAGRYDIRLAGLEFQNADLAGSLQGTYRTTGEGPGSADFDGRLTRADARRVAHYLPLVVSQSTRDWVRSSIVAGHSRDVKWRLEGDLSRFPFVEGEKGTFEVLAKARGGILDYADGWPRIENIVADIRFSANRLEVKSSSATILGAQLSRVHAVIPDIVGDYEVIEASGEAEAPTAQFARFIEASPVAEMTDRFLDGMQAQGRGRLALELTMPLRELEKSRVAGSYRFLDNRLTVDDALPALENVDGVLQFTESSVLGRHIGARIFGGPATIAVEARGGVVSASVSGRASVEAVRQSIDSPLLGAFSGAAGWRSTLQVRAKTTQFVIESGLQGIASSLPAPFGKAADDIVPLRIERHVEAPGQDAIRVRWGKLLAANIQRATDGRSLVVERAAIGLNAEPPAAEGAGIRVQGKLPGVDLDRWRALLAAGDVGPSRLPVVAVDLELGTADLFGRRFHDLSVQARQSERWRLHVSGREMQGDIAWGGQDMGRVVARLERLALPAASPRAEEPLAQPQPAPNSEYPALDVVVDAFSYEGRALGRLELNAVPQGRDWRIERLELRNPDATLNADGYWQWQAAVPRTEMRMRVEVADIGKLLARMNYPKGVQGGTASLEGTLGWNGAPQDFDFPTLDGALSIQAARGQFVKLDPGIGKLLSILSLQALPRRVALDFKDVFSEGFAFDSIQGKVQIQHGVAMTDSFRITGSSARVMMSGKVDLNRETQALKVRVTPSVGDSVATVTALLGGPVAGIGVYLAQKLLNDPLGQLVAYDYSVTGTWSDPAVSKIGFERQEHPG